MCNRIIFAMLLVMAVKVRAECERPFLGQNRILVDEVGQQTFPDGATVKFKCSTGYVTARTTTSRSITCNGTQWSELKLQCEKKSCGNPGDILQGTYEIEDGILFGAVITAVCNEGYHLFGPVTRNCREGGWDKRAPVCEALKCKKPLAITNGEFGPVMESYEYGDVVQYSCFSGFDLFGEGVLTCSSNETFQPALPRCLLVSCDKPEILHAHKTEGKSPPYKYRQFVRYECNEGYKMEGPGLLTCTEKGWNPALPRCDVITCTNPPNLTNGLFNPKKEFYDYKEKVTYSCIKGFKLSDASSISCTLDGTFEPLLSQCVEIVCLSPVIPNGFVKGSSQETYTYNAQVQIGCNEGYKIEESDILTCNEPGWSPSVLRCIAVTCDKPNISNGFIIGGESPSYKYKALVFFKCNSGYSRAGSLFLNCTENGWDQPSPHCSLGYWIWIMFSLVVLCGAVVVCFCLYKNKLMAFISPKKKSDVMLDLDQSVLVSVSPGASPAEESFLKK